MQKDTFQFQILEDSRLKPADVKTAITISLFLNRDDYEEGGRLHAWPSLDTIAMKTKLTKRTVQRSIRRLAEFGHFCLVEGTGRGHSHHYEPVIKRGLQLVA